MSVYLNQGSKDMPSLVSVRAPLAVVLSASCLLSVRPVLAGSAHNYDRSGKVISVTRDVVPVYRIESEDSIYTMACVRIRLFYLGVPQCDWNGRPIAKGDQVRFRIEGDYAYMPVKGDEEERLMVEMTEAKLLPPLPSAPAGLEGAVVLGLGVTAETHQYAALPSPQPSTSASSSSSSGSMAPVVAVPATGGAPEVVIPTSPTTGGAVTGVPATGGAPITAIPVAPTAAATSSSSNISAPSAPSGGTTSTTQWVHILRVQTASHIYDLACSGRTCALNGTPIQTGDALTVRVEKKWAYVSSAGGSREQRFAILSVRDVD